MWDLILNFLGVTVNVAVFLRGAIWSYNSFKRIALDPLWIYLGRLTLLIVSIFLVWLGMGFIVGFYAQTFVQPMLGSSGEIFNMFTQVTLVTGFLLLAQWLVKVFTTGMIVGAVLPIIVIKWHFPSRIWKKSNTSPA